MYLAEIINNSYLFGAFVISITLLTIHSLVTIVVMVSLRAASRERHYLHREMFGILKKIEGLTATKKEQIQRAYDILIAELSTKLPPTLEISTSNAIFETESKILTRLAELEPNLKRDKAGQEKMDDLIKSMERLEQVVVTSVSETVKRVMEEGRRDIFDDESIESSDRDQSPKRLTLV